MLQEPRATSLKHLSILDFGLFQVHQNERIIGIPGYFIQSSEGNILVDSGFPLLELPKAESILLIAAAISRPAELQEGFGGAWNEAQAALSAERLIKLASEKNALIIDGHDPAQ